VKKGQLVRLKKGLYTGDLAKIVYIYPDMYEVVLKLVPRLEKIDEDLTPDEIKKRSIK